MENIVNFLMDPRLGSLYIHSDIPQTDDWEDTSYVRFTPWNKTLLNAEVFSTCGEFSVRILKDRKELAAFLAMFCGEVDEVAGAEEKFFVSAKKF